MKHKKPHPKTKPNYDPLPSPKPKSPYRPKWQVEREEEHPFCQTLRDNVRQLSSRRAIHQRSAARLGSDILERQRAIDVNRALLDEVVHEFSPVLIDPKVTIEERRRWALRLLRVLGRLSGVVTLAELVHSTGNAIALERVKARIRRAIEESEERITSDRNAQAGHQAEIDELSREIDLQFERYEAFDCPGKLLNSVRF